RRTKSWSMRSDSMSSQTRSTVSLFVAIVRLPLVDRGAYGMEGEGAPISLELSIRSCAATATDGRPLATDDDGGAEPNRLCRSAQQNFRGGPGWTAANHQINPGRRR